MPILEEKLRSNQEKYQRFLAKKLQPYRSWQSYGYFSTHYYEMFEQTSTLYIEFILYYKGFIFSDWDLIQMSNQFFEGIVSKCEERMKSDFERTVIVEESYIQMIQ